ncbi:MAG: hypothetical protein J0H94_04370 [Rhizobiales bacterium]|nr:hypothetical protein [Hyphomicrobiales bacterium]
MAQTVLTADIIAKEAVMILENELVMAKRVFRGYENEFEKKINGYEVGETISIRRPTDFTVRTNATMAAQDVVEGKTSITVDQRRGVDFKFTSQDLTLKIGELSERVIKPAMVRLANAIDTDLMSLYKYVPNWVGTPGQVVNSYADFALAPQRMDEFAVPDERVAVLSPADHWGLLGSQTALYIQDAAKGAYRKGSLGEIGGVDTYMSQNVPTHIVGADVSGTVNQSITSATIDYATVKDTMQQTITVASLNLNPGDVFTIANVNAVNPVSKADLGFAKQFVCISYSSNSLVFYPAMVWTGAFQNVAVASGTTDLNSAAITAMGTATNPYKQNLVFHRNAFALVTVPLVKPPGAVDVARQNYKGINVRVIPVYDGVNDESAWRLDLLYGKKAIDPRLALRLSGT